MKKVLIVDDDRDLREVMKTVLSRDFEVHEAGSMREGFAVLQSYTPDLVLLDVMMETDTAGFEMARKLKSSPEVKRAKILMITNVDRKQGLDFRSEAGDPAWLPVDDYVLKPVDPAELLTKVRKMLG